MKPIYFSRSTHLHCECFSRVIPHCFSQRDLQIVLYRSKSIQLHPNPPLVSQQKLSLWYCWSIPNTQDLKPWSRRHRLSCTRDRGGRYDWATKVISSCDPLQPTFSAHNLLSLILLFAAINSLELLVENDEFQTEEHQRRFQEAARLIDRHEDLRRGHWFEQEARASSTPK